MDRNMTTTFQAEVFQNQFLPQGASEVHAIVTVASEGAAIAPSMAPPGGKLFGIVCDISGSMDGEKLHAAKEAMIQLIGLIPDDTHFFITAGSNIATVVFPASPANTQNKLQAVQAVRRLRATGSTMMSTWLNKAVEQFETMPDAVRQALLLTDGLNDKDDAANLANALARSQGVFQCDCRGVGTDWDVGQLRAISNSLLGSTDIIARPADIAADFQAVLATAVGKSVSDVAIRLWTPVDATVMFCKEVSPSIVDLTALAKSVNPRTLEYPTGAWSGTESRDYHFAIQVNPGNIGDEMLAGRATLVMKQNGAESKIAEARILAVWTGDDAKSTRIERHVAHYTGQAELAQSIQDGLEAKAQGREDAATALLGKAVKIAHDSGNEATAKLLRSVVDVDDPATGTVRLKRGVAKEDEMALETRSTKTKRVQKA
jgi:uncharacterized protein YegL